MQCASQFLRSEKKMFQVLIFFLHYFRLKDDQKKKTLQQHFVNN